MTWIIAALEWFDRLACSIPAEGPTFIFRVPCMAHHHHAGGDQRVLRGGDGENIFQSTPPRRWWQQIYTTIHTYIRQFSYKSFTATTYHLQTLQIHPKNTNYSWFPRCEPPRGFMGTSHSHGRIWKLKVIQNICFTPLFMDSIIVKAHQHNVGAEKGIIRSNWP